MLSTRRSRGSQYSCSRQLYCSSSAAELYSGVQLGSDVPTLQRGYVYYVQQRHYCSCMQAVSKDCQYRARSYSGRSRSPRNCSECNPWLPFIGHALARSTSHRRSLDGTHVLVLVLQQQWSTNSGKPYQVRLYY